MSLWQLVCVNDTYAEETLNHVLSVRGIEMMTPFPVPTHSRLHETIRAVILTKEKPSLPVPEK